MVAQKKGKGGKLARSEVITVRLDPKLRFAAELVARKQRRTLSSFVEWAIEQAVSQETVQVRCGYDNLENQEITALKATASVWDVDEADRFIKFAETCPELLNFNEEHLWKTIKETPYFFLHVEKNNKLSSTLSWDPVSSNIWYQRVRDCWDLLQKIADGQESRESLPAIPENEIQHINDGFGAPSEIPF